MNQLIATVFQFVNPLLAVFIKLFLAIIGIIFLKKIVSKLLFRRALNDGNSLAFIMVKVPSTNEKKEKAMEEFLHSLHHVLPNNTPLSLEIASINQFLHFYIGIQAMQKNILESQLYAQYPEAEIEDSGDYFLTVSGNAAFTQLHFKRHSMYPLKTQKIGEEDFLKNLSAFLSKTDRSDKIFFQIALKRVGSRFFERGFRDFYFRLFGRKYDSEGKPYPAQTKLSQDLYKGKLRLAYIAHDRSTAESRLNALIGLFKDTKSEYNELKKERFLFLSNLDKSFGARSFENGELWMADEIATVYHLPYKDSIVSNVVKTISKKAPAPEVLPQEGLVDPKGVSFFAKTNYRAEEKKFGIKRIDRRRHVYVVGKTGSGKSRLLELLLISDIQNGDGCCLLDPHGDLAGELLLFIPKERIEEVVYVNPTDRDYPIGFNPLEYVEDYVARQHLGTFFIAIFKKLFGADWNPRMEHLIRYITLALLETRDSNVLGIPRILSDISFRQKVIKQIQDPVVKSFWVNEFSGWNERFANDAVIPILNKVGQFIANPIIRNMVGQIKNTLDFERFMNEGKIVIINISKGKLGEENAALLGSMFITKIQQAALARAKLAEHERRDFYFYVDEFQNFATEAFSTILSEARKYHLNLTIAHQYIAQLPEDVKATAFGNVGTIIVFAVGGSDAISLASEFTPVFTPEDMIGLNVREMYIKMSIDGKAYPPFSARTINVPRPTLDNSIEILELSRMKYARDKRLVEKEIAAWTQAESLSVSSAEKTEKGEFPEPII